MDYNKITKMALGDDNIITQAYLGNNGYILQYGEIPIQSLLVEYLAIAGGGGGGNGDDDGGGLSGGGGGGAGGLISSSISLPFNQYDIRIGGGGAPETNGGDSWIRGNDTVDITLYGGGTGGSGRGGTPLAGDGGSGGGGVSADVANRAGGSPLSGQGQSGGTSLSGTGHVGSGGGGRDAAGEDGGQTQGAGGAGGNGRTSSITGTPTEPEVVVTFKGVTLL
mgnify:FL=1